MTPAGFPGHVTRLSTLFDCVVECGLLGLWLRSRSTFWGYLGCNNVRLDCASISCDMTGYLSLGVRAPIWAVMPAHAGACAPLWCSWQRCLPLSRPLHYLHI